jgi:hypothetical protein
MKPSTETELIRALVEGTHSGEIAWTRNAFKKGFNTEIDGSFLEIRRTSIGSLPDDALVLEIRKSDGTVVDKIEAAPRDSLASMLRGTHTLHELWKLLGSGNDSELGS